MNGMMGPQMTTTGERSDNLETVFIEVPPEGMAIVLRAKEGE